MTMLRAVTPLAGRPRDRNLIVIANREPYSHEWEDDGSCSIRRPASGLVTAIEPVLRTRGGTWVAHASGSADRASSTAEGRVAVPPESPLYTLRRVWLPDTAYERYYSGLSNEGLWPLCHLAHMKPAFRRPDWSAYQEVNEVFAAAAFEEMTGTSMVLIQDYHFALVPLLIRQRARQATSSLFWHIPWPSAETIGIFPWKERLLKGMLGADILGFHTIQYCRNFLETVQRYLHCRVDFDDLSVFCDGRTTLIRPYPISVEWPYPASSRADGENLRASLGIAPDVHVSLGVDRVDYTKGLPERIAAIELLFERNPALRGRYVFVQLASPSRVTIPAYQQLAAEVRAAVERVNNRFGTPSWQPIILQMKTIAPEEVRVYYAMANSAVVTPLHDGMNLVAKEYVASCTDGDGALVLSIFAGAAQELNRALLVNPYDCEQVADAMAHAVHMSPEERRGRIQAMRRQIAANSIQDWTKRLLGDMAQIQRRRSVKIVASAPRLRAEVMQ